MLYHHTNYPFVLLLGYPLDSYALKNNTNICFLIPLYQLPFFFVLLCYPLHRYALKNFRQVITHCEFLDLQAKDVIDYLGDDNINLRSEEECFDALLKWVQHDVDHRKIHMGECLRCIRLPYVTPSFLEEHISREPLVMESIECEQLVQETRVVQNMIREGRQNNDPRMKPRRAFCDVTFVVGGRNKHEAWIQDTCYYDNIRRKWFPLESFPCYNTEYKVVSLQNDVYVVGGRHKEGHLTGDTWRYNSLFNEWSQVRLKAISSNRAMLQNKEQGSYCFTM